jgi:hypothetical protein
MLHAVKYDRGRRAAKEPGRPRGRPYRPVERQNVETGEVEQFPGVEPAARACYTDPGTIRRWINKGRPVDGWTYRYQDGEGPKAYEGVDKG